MIYLIYLILISHVRLDLNALSGPTFQLDPGYKLCCPFFVVTLLSLLVHAYWPQTVCSFWKLISGLGALAEGSCWKKRGQKLLY